MQVVVFRYRGRFAHFLRAEATANALSYPVPPRTVLLGLAGAILGMPKDTVQTELAEARFAVGGELPQRFWHKANLRKNLPAPLNVRIKKTDKGSSQAEKNTRIPQEWLWNPDYKIWAAFPDPYHDEFAARLREGRSHFTPCLGLSEMVAEVEWIEDNAGTELPLGEYEIDSSVSLLDAKVNSKSTAEKQLAVHRIRMPRDVSPERVFTHADYLLERSGRAIPVATDQAWQVGAENVMFL